MALANAAAPPLVLVPGLASSLRIWAEVLPELWRAGPVMVANHLRDDSVAAIARRVLADAPARFTLAGHSMGGYIAFEIMRQAPERVIKLALLNTQARPDTADAVARRRVQIEAAQAGRLDEVLDELFPLFVHPSRQEDATLRRLVHAQGDDVRVDGFVNNLTAIIGRPDSRPDLGTIRCPVLVLTSDQDLLLPKALSEEIASAIPQAQLHVIAECGHLSPVERPAEVAAALVAWRNG